MDKIRILYITKLKNSLANGVTVAVTQLFNSICNYAEIGWLDFNSVDLGIDKKVKRLNSLNWQEFNPDIAVFEDPFNTIQFCDIASALRKNKIPYVICPHGCFTRIALQKKSLKKHIAIKTILKNFLKNCAATQFLCENEKCTSLQFNDALVIPNGIVKKEKYKTVKEIKKIVFIGRKDVRHKGIDYLLEAVQLEAELLRLKGVKLYIYGAEESNKDELYIRRFIENHNLGDIVINNGTVFGSEKENILLNSDMFILTSRHEGFPMSILEALSYGLPVLITHGTNMQDIIHEEDAGWVCETDSLSIAKTIRDAINCESVIHKSQNARNLSMKYTWDQVSLLTIKAYNSLLNQNNNKSYGEGLAITFYRIERYFYTKKLYMLSKISYYLMQVILGCVIPPQADIGKGCSIGHSIGIVIHHDTIIGCNTKIYQNVTIANSGVIVGNNCLIGAGAVILGPCVIGDNVKIGANSVVNFDVADNSTVIGQKGKVLCK